MSIKSVAEVQSFWNNFADTYVTQDDGTNVFYLSLINMLKLEQRNSILEVGAGAGFLYHHTLERKKPDAKYTATDLSEKMLQIMCKRLHIEQDISKSIVIDKYNLTIENANGEALPYADSTFDCYIANLCLQLTTDPFKLLAESYRVLSKGGVAGFSVWGDRDKSSFFNFIPSTMIELGYQPPQSRSNFYLNDRDQLIKMMEGAGFTSVICWNQFSPFHHQTEEEIQMILNFPTNAMAIEMAAEQKEEIKIKLLEKLREHIQVKKYPFGLDGLLIIGIKN